jgi:hypothetical protein
MRQDTLERGTDRNFSEMNLHSEEENPAQIRFHVDQATNRSNLCATAGGILA